MKIVKDYKAFTSSGGFGKKIGTLFFNPCFHSVILYRFSSALHNCKLDLFAKIIWYINRVVFSVDIDYRAKLAGGFVLIHGLGTVIGKDVISKGRLTVYQGVTIGGSGKSVIIDEKEYWQPILEDGVKIFTNAMVLGPVQISKNTVVKAGERVTSNR